MAKEPMPVWGYRKEKDAPVEAKLFEDGVIPKGWKDTPAEWNDPAYTTKGPGE